MNVFIGGSRHISHLPENVKERLYNIMYQEYHVLVGDANGADKAVQKFLTENSYFNVTVYCSGHVCRNNLGKWDVKHISTSKTSKDFEFYATKDRAMAVEADFGLMIWDGKSIGTIMNILRLVHRGKKSVLYHVPDQAMISFKSLEDWDQFILDRCDAISSDIRKRTTPEEWQNIELPRQADFLDLAQHPL
jgi:hypothetical protein